MANRTLLPSIVRVGGPTISAGGHTVSAGGNLVFDAKNEKISNLEVICVVGQNRVALVLERWSLVNDFFAGSFSTYNGLFIDFKYMCSSVHVPAL